MFDSYYISVEEGHLIE